jgi:hypothetical protein
MHLAVVTNLETIPEGLNPTATFKYNNFVDAGLQLDVYRFQQQNPVDYVLFLQQPVHSYEKFLQAVAYIGENTDTVYITELNNEHPRPFNFYCRPEVFSMISATKKKTTFNQSMWPTNFVPEQHYQVEIMYAISSLNLPSYIL